MEDHAQELIDDYFADASHSEADDEGENYDPAFLDPLDPGFGQNLEAYISAATEQIVADSPLAPFLEEAQGELERQEQEQQQELLEAGVRQAHEIVTGYRDEVGLADVDPNLVLAKAREHYPSFQAAYGDTQEAVEGALKLAALQLAPPVAAAGADAVQPYDRRDLGDELTVANFWQPSEPESGSSEGRGFSRQAALAEQRAAAAQRPSRLLNQGDDELSIAAKWTP